jgi:hypothetical protein
LRSSSGDDDHPHERARGNCTPFGACVRRLDGVRDSYRVSGTDRFMIEAVVRSIATSAFSAVGA